MLEVLFIGTGDAFGSGGRRNSAILLRDCGRTLLLDCGPSTLMGLKQLGVDPLEIDAVAISHFHGDHAAGLPFLLLDHLYERQRESPLRVLGPPGVQARLERIAQSFEYPSNDWPFDVSYSEFDCNAELVTGAFKLKPFPALHQAETCPHMLRVEAADHTIFFSGDTGWHEELPEHVGEVELFICEATLFEESFEYHLSCTRLQKERRRFKCRRMLLTHLGSEVLENLERVDFDLAHDGLSLKL
jgi:ribonuclease BN (tRNA processing enzyme)